MMDGLPPMPILRASRDPCELLVSFGATLKYDQFSQEDTYSAGGQVFIRFAAIYSSKKRFQDCSSQALLQAVEADRDRRGLRFQVFCEDGRRDDLSRVWVRAIPRRER